jgi:hypothetical protein
MSSALSRIIRKTLILSALAAVSLSAQHPDSPPLADVVNAKYSRADAQAIVGVLSEAQAQRLPMLLLTAKVREGLAMNADGARVLATVRSYAKALGDARDALGATANPTELEAAAGALRMGLPAAALKRMRAARPSRSLSAPLVVAVDLVQRGVPVDSVSAGLVSLLGAGAGDSEFLTLQSQFAHAMMNGQQALPAYRSLLAAPRGMNQSVVHPPDMLPDRP